VAFAKKKLTNTHVFEVYLLKLFSIGKKGRKIGNTAFPLHGEENWIRTPMLGRYRILVGKN